MRVGIMATALGLLAGGCLEATPGSAGEGRGTDAEPAAVEDGGGDVSAAEADATGDAESEAIGDGGVIGDSVAPCDCPIPVLTVREGDEVLPQTRLHLDGAQSRPCSGEIASYEWRVDQPDGSASVFQPSAYVASPTFEVDVVGIYRFTLAVGDEGGAGPCEPATYEVTATDGGGGLRVELTWVTPNDPDESDEAVGSDLDLHLLHPYAQGAHDRDGDGLLDGWFDTTFDCFWLNEQPQWGVLANRADDPEMQRDDTDGVGPEVIVLRAPEAGLTYKVGVHYYNAHGFGPSAAMVRIYADRRLVFEARDILLQEHDLWTVAEIPWPLPETGPVAPRVCEQASRRCTSDVDCGGARCLPKVVPGYTMPGEEP